MVELHPTLLDVDIKLHHCRAISEYYYSTYTTLEVLFYFIKERKRKEGWRGDDGKGKVVPTCILT